MWRRPDDPDPAAVLRAHYDAACAARDAAWSRFQEADPAWADCAWLEWQAAEARCRALRQELRRSHPVAQAAGAPVP